MQIRQNICYSVNHFIQNKALHIGSVQLEAVAVFKYLGCQIDNDLSFAALAAHICAKLRACAGILAKCYNFLSRKSFQAIVFA